MNSICSQSGSFTQRHGFMGNVLIGFVHWCTNFVWKLYHPLKSTLKCLSVAMFLAGSYFKLHKTNTTFEFVFQLTVSIFGERY